MPKRWFVLHTYSGYENKVKTDLEHRVESYGLEGMIDDIQVPTEEVTEIKDGGERNTKESKVFPGYVLVHIQCVNRKVDDDTWTIVRNTPGVTGFLGLGNEPVPLRRDEYNKIMRRTNRGKAGSKGQAPVSKRTETNLEVGQAVKVVSGPLADFDGQVSEVMADQGKVKVMLTIFGRETPVELTLDQVQLIQ